jgi:hypothetical protein
MITQSSSSFSHPKKGLTSKGLFGMGGESSLSTEMNTVDGLQAVWKRFNHFNSLVLEIGALIKLNKSGKLTVSLNETPKRESKSKTFSPRHCGKVWSK